MQIRLDIVYIKQITPNFDLKYPEIHVSGRIWTYYNLIIFLILQTNVLIKDITPPPLLIVIVFFWKKAQVALCIKSQKHTYVILRSYYSPGTYVINNFLLLYDLHGTILWAKCMFTLVFKPVTRMSKRGKKIIYKISLGG